MRNISDNELDKLFQDAAQRIEPEFDPGDWDKLSKRIDRSDRINLFKRIAIYLSLALLIMFSAWLGINYYQGQSDTKNNSANNSDAGIDNEVSDHVAASKTPSTTDTSASAEYAGIDADDDNGTPTGSLTEGGVGALDDQKEAPTSSAGDQASLSSDRNTDTQETKDIVAADQQRAIASTSGTRPTTQNASGRKNTSGESISAADQQRIQKRTIAGESENRDEGSRSASGNSKDSSRQDSALNSENQKETSAVKKDAKSSSPTSVQPEKSETQPANIVSDKEVTNRTKQMNENAASDAKRSSTASVNTVSGEEQSSANANSKLAGNSSSVDVKNDSSNQSDEVKVNNNTRSSRLKNTEASLGAPDTLAVADTRAKAKNDGLLNNESAASGSATANQSANANRNIASTDSLSRETPVLKSKDNTSSDTKGIVEKSTGNEKTTGAILNDPSVKKSTSKEDSLQGRTPAIANAYSENKGISTGDSTFVNRDGKSQTNSDTRKIATGKVENAKIHPTKDIDHTPGTDSLSHDNAVSKSKAIDSATSDKGDTFIKGDQVLTKSPPDAVVQKQTTSATNEAVDSLSNQQSAIGKTHEKSNEKAVNDSTLTKPVTKADSLNRVKNSDAANNKRDEDKKAKESSWYVKLLVSPDFSSIGYNKPGKTGVNIGLTVEYSPSKHWGFSTGAIWSKKLYDKNNPGKSYSYGGASFEADYLDGDCRVLDIPINITYYILPEARLNFYATVGVSSYIMLKENYVYVVTENNNNFYYYEDYKNQNRHWFSMLNISFGLQYRISPRLQLQAEPFLKAPMSGVGQGKIDLVSAGSFFTLKYRFNK